jgi:hypothetical protein
MRSTFILTALLLAAVATPATADPILSVIPQGLQGGNWVWEVDINPGSGGPQAIDEEIGFRLTGDPLVSVTNLSPALFDTNNPGNPIFGWETAYGIPPFPEGIEAKCSACTVVNAALLGGHASTVVPGTTNEIFSAMGTAPISGTIPFLRIVALGPANGGPSTSSIQWLGAYNGNGRIAEAAGNFDHYAGTASQSVPEPSTLLLAAAAIGFLGMNWRSTRTAVV